MTQNSQEKNSSALLTSLLSQEEEGFDYKKFVTKIISNWPLFLICILFFGSAAYLYRKLSTPNYKIKAMMIVSDDKPGASDAGAGSGLSTLTDISSLLGVPNNAENEAEILKSRSIVTNVVKDLQLNVITYRNGNIKDVELFDEAPFSINITYKTDSIEGRKYIVQIKNDIIHLTSGKDDIDVKAKFGEVISLPKYNLTFTPRPDRPINNRGYSVVILSTETSVENLSNALEVALTSKTTTTINLTLEYPNSKKGEAILNDMMQIYLQDNIKNKVQIADSTLKFINC